MMNGLFGDDFDETEPSDSSLVKLGASWIRDLKSRLKRFCQIMFSLETGDFKDNVVRSDSLIDQAGLTPGTYNKVTVNSKGLATSAENEDLDTVAAYYIGRFEVAGSSVDTETGVTTGTGTGRTYGGTGTPYNGTYNTLNGASYVEYSFTVPDGVRRVKAIVVGGGGGSSAAVAGFSVYSSSAEAATTTTGTWGWVAVPPAYDYPLTVTIPGFYEAFRTKTVAVDPAEKLDFDDGAGGGVADLMLPGLVLRNKRTNEKVRVVGFNSVEEYTVERAQDGTSAAAVNDNDEWEVLVYYGGAGGEHVEGTLAVTPGETLAVIVGAGGAEDQPGAPSGVSGGAGHLEAGGGEKGTGGAGGAAVSGSKSTNVGYSAASGAAGAVGAGGRSGSNLSVSAELHHGDGGPYYNGRTGQDGVVILEWIA